MGGGFGGCTINLVKEDLYDAFIEKAKAGFKEKYGHEPIVIDVVISDGARKVQEYPPKPGSLFKNYFTLRQATALTICSKLSCCLLNSGDCSIIMATKIGR